MTRSEMPTESLPKPAITHRFVSHRTTYVVGDFETTSKDLAESFALASGLDVECREVRKYQVVAL